MILIIDNYDSFTYNIYQYICELGYIVEVHKNDRITIADIKRLDPSHIIISPGPGRPENSGVSVEVIKELSGKIPILGVCLGHQVIGHVFGADIINADDVMHGKISVIEHDSKGVFDGLKTNLKVVRYHSLVIDEHSLSDDFVITSWTKSSLGRKEIMGISHKSLPIEGVQFHPESILSEEGLNLLTNFIKKVKL